MLKNIKKFTNKSLFLPPSKLKSTKIHISISNQKRYQKIIDDSLKKLSFKAVKKNGLFYELPSNYISINPLQESRYELNDKKIILFENKNREKKVFECLNILKERNELFIGGATGLGKSHLFSLLVCYLTKKIISESEILNFSFEEFFQAQKIRVLYINNPQRYFDKLKFEECIIPDMIYAFGQDYGKIEYPFIKKIFDNTDFSNPKDCSKALKSIVFNYEQINVMPIVGIDQWNIIERFKIGNIRRFQFFQLLIEENYKYSILSAPNTNDKTISLMKEKDKAAIVTSKDFFLNFHEYSEYVKKLGYFKKANFEENIHKQEQPLKKTRDDSEIVSDEFLEDVANLTSKNPSEIMILNSLFQNMLQKIDKTKKNFEFDNLEKTYLENKNVVITSLNDKFVSEYKLNPHNYELFIRKLDTGIKIETTDYSFINHALMEIKDDEVYSLCKAVELFYKTNYHILNMNQKNKQAWKFSWFQFENTKNGKTFQELVSLWLSNMHETTEIKGINHSLKNSNFSLKLRFPRLNKNENSLLRLNDFSNEDYIESELPNLLQTNKTVFIVANHTFFDLIDFIYIKVDTNQKGIL